MQTKVTVINETNIPKANKPGGLFKRIVSNINYNNSNVTDINNLKK